MSAFNSGTWCGLRVACTAASYWQEAVQSLLAPSSSIHEPIATSIAAVSRKTMATRRFGAPDDLPHWAGNLC
jgi:hypothetical protein